MTSSPRGTGRETPAATADLLDVNLNLLVPLHALLTERSVTEAANRTSVSQSAMSSSLAKLRHLLDDPLLVKDGRRMALTPVAEALLGQVTEVLSAIGSLLGRTRGFDPAVDRRGFVVAASDYLTLVLVRKLVHELDRHVPGVRLTVLRLRPEHIERASRGQCDLVLCQPTASGEDLSGFSSVELLTDELVAVVADDHPDVRDRLRPEQLSTVPYVHVAELSPAWGQPPAATVATTETFTTAAHMLPGTRMFPLGQRRLFATVGPAIGLRAVGIDPPLPTTTERMYWHPGFDGDPAHQWLRSTLQRLAAEVDTPEAG